MVLCFLCCCLHKSLWLFSVVVELPPNQLLLIFGYCSVCQCFAVIWITDFMDWTISNMPLTFTHTLLIITWVDVSEMLSVGNHRRDLRHCWVMKVNSYGVLCNFSRLKPVEICWNLYGHHLYLNACDWIIFFCYLT